MPTKRGKKADDEADGQMASEVELGKDGKKSRESKNTKESKKAKEREQRKERDELERKDAKKKKDILTNMDEADDPKDVGPKRVPDDSGNSPRNQANRADNTEKKRATGVKEARQKLEDVDQGYSTVSLGIKRVR